MHYPISYVHCTWFFPENFVASKLVHWGEDLRQGSNQVRNQVLRHQGNFCWWKGRISPHPLMLLGPLEKYSSKKLLKDMFIWWIYKPTRNQWQCKVSICGICSKRFNAIWLWLPRSHAVMVELKPCCGSAMRRVKRFHSDTVYWPVDLTWLFLLNWCTTGVLIGPQDRRAQWVPSQGFKLSWEWKSFYMLIPHLQGFEPRIYLHFPPKICLASDLWTNLKGFGQSPILAYHRSRILMMSWTPPEAEKAPPRLMFRGPWVSIWFIRTLY